ncbi:MAG: Flp family type IVb pilin [Planctomycetota bacterium]
MKLPVPQAIVEFLQREDGPTAVEYAVMLALIIVVCITAITALGSNANVTFSDVTDSMADVDATSS